MKQITILMALTCLSPSLASAANSGGKAMDCAECAESYCGGDKSCKECRPLCGSKRSSHKRDAGSGDSQRTADEDAGEFGSEEEAEQ